jgi:hypothetical protein
VEYVIFISILVEYVLIGVMKCVIAAFYGHGGQHESLCIRGNP